MTAAAVREMPRVVFPKPGESFASWMLRLAARLDLDPSTLQTRTGLVDERRGTIDDPVGYGVTLTEQQRTSLAFATRTRTEAIDATLLSWLDGGPVTLANLTPGDGASLRKVALFQWAYFSSSHACGDCLQGNGWSWPLSWRLPWHYACTTHGRFLAATCPRCTQPFMIARRDRIYGPPLASRVPVPEQCNNPLPPGVAVRARTAVACGHPLHDLPTPTVGSQSLLAAQANLLDHVRLRDRDHAWWTDLRAVASLLMRFLDLPAVDALLPGLPDPVRSAVDAHWVTVADQKATRAALDDHRRGPRSRTHTDTPADPVLFAPFAALALSAVTTVAASDGEPVVLRALHETSRQNTSATLPLLLRERGASPGLVAVVAAFSNRNAILTRAPAPTPGGDGSRSHTTVEPKHVPWLWWPDRYDHVAPLFPADMTEDFARAYLSLAAVKVLTRGTWVDAAEAIGWYTPRKAIHTANSNISRLRNQGTLDTVHEHVHEVLAAIAQTDDRVDYVSRRANLAGILAITLDQWNDMTAQAGSDLVGKTWRLRGVAAWLWHQYGLNPLKEYPGFAAHGSRETAVEMYRRFRNDDLPMIEVALVALADTLEMA